ncbi:MAG: cytochrome c maturation protein CcmE [Candidatus Latescibacterota bacterium]|nr:MAG: cytochrome c maturation protein CcmE [Candidatus Latescibacterota bacterium]
MRRKNLRVVFGVIVVVVAMGYFGFAGFQEGKAYYKTIEELNEMGEKAYGKRIKVAGIVTEGTIVREGKNLHFRLEQNELGLSCVYTGSAPVPDTFKDGVEAVCEGNYREDGSFEAKKIQAKCASKYQSKYGTAQATGH